MMRVSAYFTAGVIFSMVVFAIMGSRALWDCGDNSGYNFRVTSSGSVQVENHSDSNEPAQEADVFINGSKVINDADVPAMKAGTSFESISPPPGSWEWRVKGETDCGDSGEHRSNTPTPPPPTKTPEPTATPEPTFTDVPTDTLTPEPTDVPPTQTANPTDTPKPFGHSETKTDRYTKAATAALQHAQIFADLSPVGDCAASDFDLDYNPSYGDPHN
jgi:hypothetical protein